MYCEKCGKKNPESSKFCQYCEINLTTLKKDHNLSEKEIHPGKDIHQNIPPYPYVISINKLLVMSIATLGLYEIYWFYKHFKSFKMEREWKITPWARALFAGFMSYSLFKEVVKAVKDVDKTRGNLNAGGLAIVYFILVSLWRLQEPYWWLSIFSVLPLIPVQNAINFYWKNKYGSKIAQSGFGTGNYIWSIIGGIILLLALNGTFGSSLNTASTTSNLGKYNQEEVASSVVNVFCPSTIPGENATGGSGTIIQEDGVILTNTHIIPQDEKNLHVDEKGCIVVLPDPTTGQPKEIYMAHPFVIPDLSDKYDLAFMTIYSAFYNKDEQKYKGIYPKKFPAFNDTTRCNNEKVKLGEQIRIFGYPSISSGYTLTITDGIVSSFPGDGLIVTSAKISHGNSGGLAVDQNGCMIGVPSLVSSDENESLGVIYSMDLVNKFSTEVMTYLNKK